MNENNQGNDPLEDEDFAALVEQTLSAPERYEPGQRIQATIVKISGDWAFLDLGGKTEGLLARQELVDEEGLLTVSEGETIPAYFLHTDRQEKIFTTKISGERASSAHLETAFRHAIPVEGTVEKEIKGGFEVRISGGVSGFCPFSQMGLRRIADPSAMVGERLAFRITEYEPRRRKVVLSHRAILEAEREKKKAALRESLHEGMVVRGVISSIKNFGAFVDLDGLEGLIPISEIAWGRVEDIHEVLQEGQAVEVVVMNLDWEKDRFAFSLKETLPDPWETAHEKYPEGSVHKGQVNRLARFGAFVTLEPGLDGLIPISNLGLGRRINHPREVLAEGQSVEVRINSLDRDKKRMSLAPVAMGRETQREDENEAFKRFQEKKPGNSLGTLGDLFKDKL